MCLKTNGLPIYLLLTCGGGMLLSWSPLRRPGIAKLFFPRDILEPLLFKGSVEFLHFFGAHFDHQFLSAGCAGKKICICAHVFPPI